MARKTEEEEMLFESFDFSGFDEDTEMITNLKPEDKDEETKKEKDIVDDDDNETFFEEMDEEIDDKSKKKDKVKDENLDDEDEEIEEVKSKKKDTPSDDSSSSFYQVLAKSLYEEGVLSSFDDKTKITEASDLIELIDKEKTVGINNYKNELPEEIKTLIENYEEGVPFDELLSIRSQIQRYDKVSEDKLADDEDLMKQLIKDDLKVRGYDDDEISEEIKDIFALDKQEARAKKALSTLKKKQSDEETALVENQRKQREADIKTQEDNIKKIKKSFDEAKEFAGIELGKKHKKEAFEVLMKPVGEVGGRQVNAITKSQMEDPIEFQKNLALAWSLTGGFKDWSVFGKATKSKTLAELEEKARLAAEKIKPGRVVKGEITDDDDETPGGFLKNIRF